LGELQRGADIQVHYRGEDPEIHGINRLMPSDAYIVDDSKHISPSRQVPGESMSIILVCKVGLDKHSREMSGGTARYAYDRPPVFD
jgi:hypothetical protein